MIGPKDQEELCVETDDINCHDEADFRSAEEQNLFECGQSYEVGSDDYMDCINGDDE